ncbi:MAG: mechanosensitive ion channel family protein [Saprospiraceae bacterium]
MSDFWIRITEGVTSELVGLAANFAPKIGLAILVLVLGFIIARFVRRLLRRIITGMGVDKLSEHLNDIEFVQRSGMKIAISSVVSAIVYYFLILAFFIIATDLLGIQVVTDMVRDLIRYLPSLLTAFALFVAGIFLADGIRKIVQTTLQSIGIPSAKLIASVVFYFLFITMAVSAMAQAKIDTNFISSNLTVVIGAGALAFALGYGLASRDLVANYLAGYYNRNKVRVGDDIRIIGVKGKVVMIDSTSLILQTEDRAIVIPLSKLNTEKVEVYYPDPQQDDLLESGPVTQSN